jgi:hypothetical protein
MAAVGGAPGTSGAVPGVPGEASVGDGPAGWSPGVGTPAGPTAPASPAGCFLGRPLPGPGLLVMGLRVGSAFLGFSPAVPFSALFWALRRPWKCWLSGVSATLTRERRRPGRRKRSKSSWVGEKSHDVYPAWLEEVKGINARGQGNWQSTCREEIVDGG